VIRILSILLVPTLLLGADLEDSSDRVTMFDAERRFESDGSRGPFHISGRPVVPGSERVRVDGKTFVRNLDYRFDTESALLTFHVEVPRGTPIHVSYLQPPVVLLDRYRLRPLPDSVGVTRLPSPRRSGRAADRISAADSSPRSNLDIGGSKSIQVGFGSGEAVTQSLRVHVTGEVAPGVELVVLLSDQNLPLEAGGRTRRVDELDRITFQVRSASVSAGLGDMEVELQETTFGRYRRRLQGARFGYTTSQGEIQMFGAVSEGRWREERVAPVDGYQGPYRLIGGGGGASGEIVPGSERIYVDSRQVLPGELQDYVIDYDRREITFTPGRPVRSSSRISVSYQYREGAYARRLVGMRGVVDVGGGDGLRLGTTFLRESDQISSAGGEGVLSSASPSHQQVTAVDVAFSPGPSVTATGEFAVSGSGTHADNMSGRSGNAASLALEVAPSALTWRDLDLGKVHFTGRFRRMGTGFSSFEQVDRPESDGRWGWQLASERAGERTMEGSLRYDVRQGIRLHGGLGNRSGERSATRKEAGFVLTQGRARSLRYDVAAISERGGRLTRHTADGETSLRWLRPGFRLVSEEATGEAVRGTSFYYSYGSSSGGMVEALPAGVATREMELLLSVGKPGDREWSSTFSVDRTQLLRQAWTDSVRSWAVSNRATLSRWGIFSIMGEHTHRQLSYGENVRPGVSTDLGRVKLGLVSGRGLRSHLTYRISSTGVSRRRDVYGFVGPGNGVYVWEDVDEDGDLDPEEFIQELGGDYDLLPDLAGGQVTPARDAAVGARVEVQGDRLWSQPLLSALSLDLSAEADRQALPGVSGVAPWSLLNFNDAEGVLGGGRSMRGDLHIFRYRRRARLTLSGKHRVGMSSFTRDLEGLRSLSLRGRFQRGRAEADMSVRREQRYRAGGGPFAYQIGAREASIDWLFRFSPGWQVGSRVEAGADREADRDLRVRYLSLRPDIRRSLPGRGRLRADFEWTRVVADESVPLFLGLAKGRRKGSNFAWSTSVDYRLAQLVTARANYRGQRRPGRPTVHIGQVEVRATF